jgi:HK97 gp10 family phage protein
MRAEFKWKVNPFQQLEKLNKGMRNKAIRIAMNKASSPVKAAVVAKAPALRGYLKKSIRIKIKNYRNGAAWVSIIGSSRSFKRGKKGKKPSFPSNYAGLVEKGTKHMKPQPFLRPSLQATRTQFQQVLQAALKDQVKQLLK